MAIPQQPDPISPEEIQAAVSKLPDDLGLPRAEWADGYLHWDELRHRKPPHGFTPREWWVLLRMGRARFQKLCPLRDSTGRPFVYALPDRAQELLHRVDQNASGSIQIPSEIMSPETRDRYIMSSLTEEAIRSSQMEGASTTRQVAKEMIWSGREPRTKGEWMILNNFRAMQEVQRLKADALTPEIVFRLHRIATENTLGHPEQAGRFRLPTEAVRVEDHYGRVLHIPPPADQLPQRLDEMCEFANYEFSGPFLHPVVRAIILHFWLAYDHPFVDGNGRCARALFYWSMLRRGYWLAEFLSISEVLHRAPAQYLRAFLYTETDQNDLTYFILYHLDVLSKAIQDLHRYVQKKARDAQEFERTLRHTRSLNHRQRALLAHALRHPGFSYSVESHRRSHNVVYQTARTDLLGLKKLGLLELHKVGRKMHFRPPSGLENRLMRRR